MRLLLSVAQRASIGGLSYKSTGLGIFYFRSFSQSAMHIHMKENDITCSEEDKRTYRGLMLNNKLKVMLISDPTTDKSAGAMDVHIGGMKDPWELPGLAHFCEHMLFLGTKKYPDENQYNKYLSEHGGGSNAFTTPNHTNYFFDVSPESFSGALDRFAQFFREPLFTETAVDREVNAVDSEHSKNIQNDNWRLNQLEKATCNQQHEYSKFLTGNKETLDLIPKEKGQSVREALLQFHKKWYSSNIMSLSVLGKESLDELEEMVVDLFADIENKEVVIPEWPEHPFGEECLQKKFCIAPVKDIRHMNVVFPIPDLHKHYKTNPGTYLGHLIGHEGSGSLLSYVKGKGWVNSLVGGVKLGVQGFAFFEINVDLTEEGLLHVDDIVTAMFQYIELLKRTGPQEWIFEECKNIDNMTFRFKDKERPQDYVTGVSKLLQYYPMKEVLIAPYCATEYKADLITELLDCLTPDNVRVNVVGKALEGDCTECERWYGTKYGVTCIAQETLNTWRIPGENHDLKLPEPNEFVPTDFTLHTDDEVTDVPAILTENSLYRAWYKLDDEFKLPKATFHAELFSPKAYADPVNTNLLHVFVQLFKDSLTEYSYAASLAGLRYSLSNTKFGLSLSLGGYNDKLAILLEKIMDKLTTFEVDPKRFEIHKERYLRGLRNFAADQPYQHLIYYTSLLLSEVAWSKDELLNFADEITVKNMNDFIKSLLSNVHIELLVHGNVSKANANQLCEIVASKLTDQCGTKPLLPSQYCRHRELQLEKGCYYVFEAENQIHKSSAVETFYQFEEQSTHENMLAEMLVQIFSEPVYEQLRTQEQLGYIVWCVLRRSNGTQGLRVILQGDKHPAYLDSRIEAFILKMKETLYQMTDDEFNCHRDSLAKRRKEKPKKLSHLSSMWWTEIMSNQYNFKRDDVEVDHLMTITKQEVIDYFEARLYHESGDRKKLSVRVKSCTLGSDDGDEAAPADLPPSPNLQKGNFITDIAQFKSHLPLYPLMTPYISFSMESKSKL